MFNKITDTIYDLEHSLKEKKKIGKNIFLLSNNIFKSRFNENLLLIKERDVFIDSLENSPKELTVSVAKLKIELKKIKVKIKELKENDLNVITEFMELSNIQKTAFNTMIGVKSKEVAISNLNMIRQMDSLLLKMEERNYPLLRNASESAKMINPIG